MKNDSTHEDYFEWWAEEAITKGLITGIERCEKYELIEKKTIPFTKILKTKETIGERHLFHPHTYTPDYNIYWTDNNMLHDDMFKLDSNSKAFFWSAVNYGRYDDGTSPVSVIDIKPDRIGRNTQQSSIKFPINQKLMWDLHGIFVQKVVLYPASNTIGQNKTLFQRAWCPEKYIQQEVYVKNRKGKWKKGDSKIKWKYKKLKELM